MALAAVARVTIAVLLCMVVCCCVVQQRVQLVRG
jgi:hypothetical protein